MIYIDKEVLFRVLEIIGASLGGIAAIVLAIIGFRKLKPEKKRIEQETNTLTAEQTKFIAEGARAVLEADGILRSDYEKQMQSFEKRFASEREYTASLEVRVDQMDEENTLLRRANNRLVDQMETLREQWQYEMKKIQLWVERLSAQVVELGGTPVKLGEIEAEEQPKRRLTDELEIRK